MADSGSAILHATIHLSGEGCCCPAQEVACPSCPQHAGPDAVPCPTCGAPAEAEVRALREALRVDGIAAQAIREGVNRLHEPWRSPRYYVREALASIDHTAADIVDRTSRALAPEPAS